MIKKELKDFLIQLSEHPNVLFVYLFGSVAFIDESDEVPPHRDIDIAVYISPNTEDEDCLKELQTNKLAYLPYEYDLVSLRSATLPLKAQIIQGNLIFAKNKEEQENFEQDVKERWNTVKVEYEAKQERDFSNLVRRYLPHDGKASETTSF